MEIATVLAWKRSDRGTRPQSPALTGTRGRPAANGAEQDPEQGAGEDGVDAVNILLSAEIVDMMAYAATPAATGCEGTRRPCRDALAA